MSYRDSAGREFLSFFDHLNAMLLDAKLGNEEHPPVEFLAKHLGAKIAVDPEVITAQKLSPAAVSEAMGRAEVRVLQNDPGLRKRVAVYSAKYGQPPIVLPATEAGVPAGSSFAQRLGNAPQSARDTKKGL